MPDTVESPRPPQLARVRTLSHVLDDLVRVPGTSRRVGLDPLLGLLPGVGDWISWVVSLHLMWSAARLGVGPALLLRMLGNQAIDAVAGAVPLVGDLFDLGWKAHSRNLALLETYVADPVKVRAQSRTMVAAVLLASLGLVAASVWAAVRVLAWTVGLVF